MRQPTTAPKTTTTLTRTGRALLIALGLWAVASLPSACRAPSGSPASSSEEPTRVVEAPDRVAAAGVVLDAALQLVRADATAAQIDEVDVGRRAGQLLEEEGDELGLYEVSWIEELRARERPTFVAADGLTPAGEATLALLGDVDAHGLSGRTFGVDRLAAELSTLDETATDPRQVDLAPPARSALVERLALTGEADPAAVAVGMLTPSSPLFQLDLYTTVSRMRLQREARERLARVELLMTDSAVRYALEMRVAHEAGATDDLPWALPHGSLESPPPAMVRSCDFGEPLDSQLQIVRLDQIMEGLAAHRGDRSEAADVLLRLHPRVRGYEDLSAAYRRYRAIVDRGGWAPLPHELDALEPELRRAVLVERLRAEGLLPEGADALTDEDVEAATRAARIRYGLPAAGGLDAELASHLNVPAEARLLQIAINLRRWRALALDSNRTWMSINLPSRRGEVLRSGERLLKFDVSSPPDHSEASRPGPAPRYAGHLASIELASVGSETFIELRPSTPSPTRLVGAGRHPVDGAWTFERPMEVGRRLLQLTGHTHIDLQRQVRDGQATAVEFNPQVPLYVTYFTVTTATDGSVRFHDDLHSEDGDLIANSGRWLEEPTTLAWRRE